MTDIYIYPAIFIYDGTGIHIMFPDLDGCVSYGETEELACKNAREVLSLHLYGMEEDGEKIPLPTTAKILELEPNQKIFVTEVYMPTFRAKMQNKYVKKTLTLPNWLNIEAERANVNFSQVLQDGLKQHLNVH
ncbi:MAG: type II toxin-antitoxin system HicB family antitoxin [Defluviitaleaceae bacterium]|nr:type II toxin-antitoxin system HicB family antitoxin [Defluviitaleaceae bacterium]